MSLAKRTLALCLAALLALSALAALAGCGDDGGIPPKKEHLSANGITTSDNGYIREELTSVELTKLMGNGINLGNTMEAYGRAEYGIAADVSKYETYWGQPVTTQESVSAMKAAGFDTLRVPVAWTNMMDFENGDYTINTAYLDRVEEIINYALNADMHVIVNDHWDGGWWGRFGSATPSVRESAQEHFVSMWTQIAERYKEYSDYLIFESANEELGNRLNDLDFAPDSGTLDENACYEKVNELNQLFVDTVRATGGNNAKRFLLIAGYNTDINMTCDKRYVMPTDTAENKLLVSIHYYEPTGYALWTSLSHWGTKDEHKAMNNALYKMRRFVTGGYGVVIGEYMVCLNDDGSVKADAVPYLTNLLNNCDMLGYCPVMWDCSSMFKRTELAIFDKDIAELYRSRNVEAQSALSDEEIINNASTALDEAYAAAGTEEVVVDSSVSTAWLMYNSSDWGVTYSVGDTYDPNSITNGVVATDAVIDGPGTYTVSLDFTGTGAGFANGTVFSAVGISFGEENYPGYIIDIKEVLVNGEVYELRGAPYTSSDDKLCTRVNLYNGWIPEAPPEARTIDGSREGISPCLLDPETLGEVRTISVTFDYVAPAGN